MNFSKNVTNSKHTHILKVILFTFVYILFFLPSSFSQTKKETYEIAMLLDNMTEEVEPLLAQLQEQIKAVVGEDANINFSDHNILINYYNLEQARLNYNKVIEGDADLIIAFGAGNNMIISNQISHKKPTILFGAVNRDHLKLDIKKRTSGIKNFTYLIESQSYEKDLLTLKELTDFKRVGIVIERAIAAVIPLKEVFDKRLKAVGASYRVITFDTAEDIISNIEDIDAVYMIGGFFLKDDEVDKLAETFIERKLPSFTTSGINHIEKGLFGTHQGRGDIEQFFRRIALNVEAYINGSALADLPIFIDFNHKLTLNYNTAELLDIPIRHSLLANTDFVGEFKNVKSKEQYNLLDVIYKAMDSNLTLKSVKKDVELATQNLKTAKSNYLPNLSASASGTYIDPDLAVTSGGQNPEFSTSGNVVLKQNIFSEDVNSNIDIQNSLQRAKQEDFNTEQLDTIFNAASTYFNTLILKANLQIQGQNLSLTKKNLQISQENFEAGKSGRSDLLRFKSQKAQNTQSMVSAANQLEQSFISLNQLLNNPINTEIDIEDVELNRGTLHEYKYQKFVECLDNPSLREPFLEFLVQEAKNNAPELKSLQYNLNAINRDIKRNGSRRFLPSVAVQGQYNRTFDRSGEGDAPPPGSTLLDDNYNIVLSASIPIFNSNQFNINKQKAKIQREQIDINKKNTDLAIESNIRSAILSVMSDMSNIELSKISEKSAAEALDLTQTAYSSGAVNVVELLDAQSNYVNAQLTRSNAIYNFLINALQVERFLGYYFLLNSKEDNENFLLRFKRFRQSKY